LCGCACADEKPWSADDSSSSDEDATDDEHDDADDGDDGDGGIADYAERRDDDDDAFDYVRVQLPATGHHGDNIDNSQLTANQVRPGM